MNNRISIVLIAALALPVGCEKFGRGPCGDRTVTVNHNADEIEPHPEHVQNICRGDTLSIRLVPPVEAGSAHTAPDPEKNPEATWLSGSNTQPDQIALVVGQEAETGRTYKYSITIGGNTLDPRVTVAK